MSLLRRVGVARAVGVNAALAMAGLVLVGLVAEGWARSKIEFLRTRPSRYVHPKAGLLYVPGSEVLATNMLDYWTISRANRWGFLDRPPPPEMNDADEPSCRVAVVGDSFVAAKELPVSDKVQVRLEEMARERLPALGIAASAYGHGGTGQINQLGFYDEFVSRTSPHIVVLVFVRNDFQNNFTVLREMNFGADRLPWTSASRKADGSFELRPPNMTPDQPRRRPNALLSRSYFAGWLDHKIGVAMSKRTLRRQREEHMRNPKYSHWFADWQDYPVHPFRFADPEPPKAAREALEYAGVGLDEWKARARRDNFLLAILASYTVRDSVFDLLEQMASTRDIPVIDQTAYIQRRRHGRIEDAHFPHDNHWNATGHQWAAEALLEWLEQNRDACAHMGGHPTVSAPTR